MALEKESLNLKFFLSRKSFETQLWANVWYWHKDFWILTRKERLDVLECFEENMSVSMNENVKTVYEIKLLFLYDCWKIRWYFIVMERNVGELGQVLLRCSEHFWRNIKNFEFLDFSSNFSCNPTSTNSNLEDLFISREVRLDEVPDYLLKRFFVTPLFSKYEVHLCYRVSLIIFEHLSDPWLFQRPISCIVIPKCLVLFNVVGSNSCNGFV